MFLTIHRILSYTITIYFITSEYSCDALPSSARSMNIEVETTTATSPSSTDAPPLGSALITKASSSGNDHQNYNKVRLRTALSQRYQVVRSSIDRLLGFPTKEEYFKFWKKLFLFDVVANVARVGGSLLLFIFAPNLYQMLPSGIVG